MNTRVPIKTNKRMGEGQERERERRMTEVAAHRLWGVFGLRGLDMKVRHHGLQTLFVFR